jgi:hypothetical protein
VAEGGVAVDDAEATSRGFVGGVVEDLDFELFGRIFHRANGLNEAVDDKLLVEDGQLDGDAGQFLEMPGGLGL